MTWKQARELGDADRAANRDQAPPADEQGGVTEEMLSAEEQAERVALLKEVSLLLEGGPTGRSAAADEGLPEQLTLTYSVMTQSMEDLRRRTTQQLQVRLATDEKAQAALVQAKGAKTKILEANKKALHTAAVLALRSQPDAYWETPLALTLAVAMHEAEQSRLAVSSAEDAVAQLAGSGQRQKGQAVEPPSTVKAAWVRLAFARQKLATDVTALVTVISKTRAGRAAVGAGVQDAVAASLAAAAKPARVEHLGVLELTNLVTKAAAGVRPDADGVSCSGSSAVDDFDLLREQVRWRS
jgi:hypothetical protein